MSATAIGEKRETTIPEEVSNAAGLKAGDRVEWRFEEGEIRGRKIAPNPVPRRIVAKLVTRGNALVFEAPEKITIHPEAINDALREERAGGPVLAP